MKKVIITMLSLIFLSSSYANEAEQENKSDKDKVQGTWQIVSGERYGKPLEGQKKDALFIFKNNKIFIGKNEEQSEKMNFTLSPDKMPKEIDFTADEEDETAKGIYKFENGNLVLCWSKPGKERPKAFKSSKEDRSAVVVLKKK